MELEKLDRQELLIDLLQAKAFFSQADICRAMKKKGLAVTQPSISRDLKELGVVRVSGRYLPRNSLNEYFDEADSSIEQILAAGPNLVVLRTKSGAAEGEAAKIDHLEMDGIVGTVAGDNTIFIAVKSAFIQKKVMNRLGKRF